MHYNTRYTKDMRKSDFPIFETYSGAYLDTAATAQRARVVVDAMTDFMTTINAPIHRGLYPLAEQATAAFEGVRKLVAEFIGAEDVNEVVFTRNTTEALNVMSQSFAEVYLGEGDEILITRMEHHANFVPWLEMTKRTGATLVIVELTEDGKLDMDDFKKKLTSRTKFVGVTHVSNMLGTINPVAEIGDMLRDHDAFYLVDAAQSVAHVPIDIKEIGCDALVFSGHKLYGPTGSGVLWARMELLEAIPPFMTGGHMINSVSDTEATWAPPPQKFEAGSPDSISIIGLGAALAYVRAIGWDALIAHEQQLIKTVLDRLAALSPVTVYGPDAESRSGVVSFTVAGVHPHDVASILAESGVAIRAGHHCAQPLHTALGIPASARISFGVYNDDEDLTRFLDALTERVLPLAA